VESLTSYNPVGLHGLLRGQFYFFSPFTLCSLRRSRSYFTADSQSVSQSVSMSRCRAHSGPCDQILLSVRRLLSEICGIFSVGRPLWREDGSAICSVVTQWSESFRTLNRTLLFHLRLPQPGGPSSRIYIFPGAGWPNYTPGHRVQLCNVSSFVCVALCAMFCLSVMCCFV
jgi:hypothetical protein